MEVQELGLHEEWLELSDNNKTSFFSPKMEAGICLPSPARPGSRPLSASFRCHFHALDNPVTTWALGTVGFFRNLGYFNDSGEHFPPAWAAGSVPGSGQSELARGAGGCRVSHGKGFSYSFLFIFQQCTNFFFFFFFLTSPRKLFSPLVFSRK